MASLSSMIALIVILLATTAYSVPVLSDAHYATSVMEVDNGTAVMQVENATVDFLLENIVVLARRDTSDVEQQERGNITVGLSSSSSSEENTDGTVQTTDQPSFYNNGNGRSFTEDSLSTEVYTNHGTEVESSHSSSAEETSIPPFIQIKNVKRSFDGSQWLSGEAEKRSFEDIQLSTVGYETSTGEETSDPTTSEVTYPKRGMEQSASLPAEAFNERAFVPTGSRGRLAMRMPTRMPTRVRPSKRGMQQSQSLEGDSAEEFNQRAIGPVEVEEFSTVVTIKKIQSESTTEEQPSTSTEVSSTWESETTDAPDAAFTRPSSVLGADNSKILAIIPGQISRTQVVAQPVTRSFAQPVTRPTNAFRSIEQAQLSQGRNQSIIEAEKPNH